MICLPKSCSSEYDTSGTFTPFHRAASAGAIFDSKTCMSWAALLKFELLDRDHQNLLPASTDLFSYEYSPSDCTTKVVKSHSCYPRLCMACIPATFEEMKPSVLSLYVSSFASCLLLENMPSAKDFRRIKFWKDALNQKLSKEGNRKYKKSGISVMPHLRARRTDWPT